MVNEWKKAAENDAACNNDEKNEMQQNFRCNDMSEKIEALDRSAAKAPHKLKKKRWKFKAYQ